MERRIDSMRLGVPCRKTSAETKRYFERCRYLSKGTTMLYPILIILLILALIGGLPAWPYSTDWGYYPSSGIAVLLVIVLVLLLAGRRRV
jgi:hypothetical protein